MSKVLIEEWVWDAVCERYANTPEDQLSTSDREVIAYMKDKLLRQTDRLIYELNLRDQQKS